MSIQHISLVLEAKGLNARHKAVLTAFCYHTDERGKTFAGEERLMREAGMPRTTFQRNRSELVEQGLLTSKRRGRRSGGQQSADTWVNLRKLAQMRDPWFDQPVPLRNDGEDNPFGNPNGASDQETPHSGEARPHQWSERGVRPRQWGNTFGPASGAGPAPLAGPDQPHEWSQSGPADGALSVSEPSNTRHFSLSSSCNSTHADAREEAAAAAAERDGGVGGDASPERGPVGGGATKTAGAGAGATADRGGSGLRLAASGGAAPSSAAAEVVLCAYADGQVPPSMRLRLERSVDGLLGRGWDPREVLALLADGGMLQREERPGRLAAVVLRDAGAPGDVADRVLGGEWRQKALQGLFRELLDRAAGDEPEGPLGGPQSATGDFCGCGQWLTEARDLSRGVCEPCWNGEMEGDWPDPDAPCDPSPEALELAWELGIRGEKADLMADSVDVLFAAGWDVERIRAEGGDRSGDELERHLRAISLPLDGL